MTLNETQTPTPTLTPTQAGRVTAHVSVSVNGEPATLPGGTTLADLLAQRGLAPEAVGTAVNGRHVPRVARPGRVLSDGDAVTLFQPIVGG